MPKDFDDNQTWPFREGESWKTGSSLKRDRQEAYIEWLLTPRAERDPKTKTDFAESIGVTAATLRNYDKEPFVQREVVRRGRGIAKVHRAADVLDALYDRATDPEGGSGSNSAAKIWLEWVDRATHQVDDVDLETMSDEELVEHVKHISEWLETKDG